MTDRHAPRWSDAEFFAAALTTIAVTRAYTGVNTILESVVVGAIEVAIGYGILCLRDLAARRLVEWRNRKAQQRLSETPHA